MIKTYYHATDPKNLSSIMEKGILAGIDKVVYLADTPEDACKFLRIRGYTEMLVVRVDIDEEFIQESFDHSEAFFKCKAYYHDGDISVDDIVDYYFYKIGRR